MSVEVVAWFLNLVLDFKVVLIADGRYPSQFVPIELLQQPIDFPIAENITAMNKIIKAPMTEMVNLHIYLIFIGELLR